MLLRGVAMALAPAALGAGLAWGLGARNADPSDDPPPAVVEAVDLLAPGSGALALPGAEGTLVDLGDPVGDAAFTLAGFRRGAPGTTVDTGVGAARRYPEGLARLTFPVHAREDATLRVGLAATPGVAVTLRVDGEDLGRHRLDEHGRGVVEAALPAGRFGPGEHEIRIRADRGPLTLDWIRADPAPLPGRPLAPPADSAPVRSSSGTLAIEPGWAVRWPLAVPPEAVLRVAVTGAPGARARVRVVEDGETPRTLASIAGGGARPATVSLDLGDLNGRVVGLELAADDGPVRVEGLALASPPEPAAPGRDARPPPPPRHAVVVLVDTLRADHLGIHGGAVPTPVIDRLARDAAVFDGVRAPTSWTKPSVATLLTGRHPWQHRATTHRARLPASEVLLPERLQGAGFETAAFVTNAYVSADYGFVRGWDHFDHAKDLPPKERDEGARAEGVARRLDRWLGDRPDPDRRTFLYVHLTEPHSPYLPPADLLEAADPAPYDGPVDFTRNPKLLEQVREGTLDLDLRDRERLRALYAAEVAALDRGLGALLDVLDRHELTDEALVLLTADHGEELLEHGSVLHGQSLYDELLHVPFVLRAPGWTDGGVRFRAAAGLADVVPTVLDLLGVPATDQPATAIPGRSMRAVLEGDAPTGGVLPAASARTAWARAIAVGRFKLIERWGEDPLPTLPFLYDLERSPDEKIDESLERPILLRGMRTWLGRALAPTGGGDAGRPRPNTVATELDPTTEAQLRALGYL